MILAKSISTFFRLAPFSANRFGTFFCSSICYIKVSVFATKLFQLKVKPRQAK
jgi:hypothetical protein